MKTLHLFCLKLVNVCLNVLKRVFPIDNDRITQKIILLKSDVPFSVKLEWEALPRAHYGYGTYQAALQAKALKMTRMSVIEFGVAGGNGLVELENVARAISQEVGIQIDVYGFDAGGGLAGSC